MAGYRLSRDGAIVGQARALSQAVPITSNRTYRFRVVAVDRRGHVSAPSRLVVVRSGHTPPSTPAGFAASSVSDSEIGLSWQSSYVPRGRVVGYRVLRDGEALREVPSTDAVVDNLAPSTTYNFAVQAVDDTGAVSATTVAVPGRTQDPVPTSGSAAAYLLATTGESFTDLQDHYRQVGTIYPTYYDCSPAGQLDGTDDPLVTTWAQARKIRVLPRVNCQRTQVLHTLLTTPAVRDAWLSAITGLVDRSNYEGISLDFEAGPASDRAALTDFVSTLADRLHQRGKLLTVAVSPKTADSPTHPRSGIFDYPALASSADEVLVMAWGLHWSTSGPGPIEDLRWVNAVADYITSLPTPGKYRLVTQLYGMDWANGGGPSHPGVPLQYGDLQALLAATGATPALDPDADEYHFQYTDGGGTPHDVWFVDAATLGARLRVATVHGLGGVGLWRLGREDQRLWNDSLLAPGAGWP